jgi:hypothetical protein
MSDNDIDASELARWDPAFTAQANKLVAPIINRWFRVEVRGLESVPPTGGVLLVSNHSGGALTPDPLVFGPAYYDRFGYHRPLYILAHYGVFFTPLRGYLGRIGAIHANPENAAKALHSGAAVLVYPGGDYDAYRPTLSQNVIDFNGRSGYVKVAIETGCRFSLRVADGDSSTCRFAEFSSNGGPDFFSSSGRILEPYGCTQTSRSGGCYGVQCRCSHCSNSEPPDGQWFGFHQRAELARLTYRPTAWRLGLEARRL